MKTLRPPLLALCAVLLGVLGPVATAAELTVFAAASLTNVLQVLGEDWQKAGGEELVFNFGASSALALQIAAGAPADVFFSADEAKMHQLGSQGHLIRGSRLSLLSNTLVVVVAGDSGLEITSPQDLLKAVKVLALAEPRTVPAGIYAREYLQRAGVWAALESKVVPVDNVRAALATVEAGNADAAIVYATDAAISKKVKVAFQVPVEEGPEISYPVALVSGTENEAAARRFVQYLASEEAKATFRRFGFLVR